MTIGLSTDTGVMDPRFREDDPDAVAARAAELDRALQNATPVEISFWNRAGSGFASRSLRSAKKLSAARSSGDFFLSEF